MEIAFAPRKDVSGPTLVVTARGIDPEAHRLIAAQHMVAGDPADEVTAQGEAADLIKK